MRIEKVLTDKKRFLPLLLLADEQEDMIDRYLSQGDLYALYDQDELRAVCVVERLDAHTCELKNLATDPASQRRGYGTAMIAHVCAQYPGMTMLLGTGEVPSILAFYQRRGFVPSHRVPNFFTEHYDHPMIEEGVLLTDMIYLKREL